MIYFQAIEDVFFDHLKTHKVSIGVNNTLCTTQLIKSQRSIVLVYSHLLRYFCMQCLEKMVFVIGF